MPPAPLPLLPATAIIQAAERVMRRCDELALCTEQTGEITRTYASPAMRRAHELVAGWMQAAGLKTCLDAAGNLRGWRPSHEPSGGQSGGQARILIGSHLDSVVNAGRYDGVLGVMIGLALAELAAECDQPLPAPLEVIGFADEEGVRFQSPYLGSRALVGDFPPELLSRTDSGGRTLQDVLTEFGGRPEAIDECKLDANQVLAFLEPHIEQGPVLEQQNIAVCAATCIVGQSRAQFLFQGQAGHAGTVPMNARRDALPVAAELVLFVEQLATQTVGLVGTIGQLDVLPNVGNVIAGDVTARLDLRHADDDIRIAAFEQIERHAARLATKRSIDCRVLWVEHQQAVACGERLIQLMEQATRDAGLRPLRLASGAGHDAAMMARRFPTGLLFIRCQGGVSHHPAEAVRVEDVAAAIEVLWRTVWKLTEV